MAHTNQRSSSASKRREQVRKERGQRLSGSQGKPSQATQQRNRRQIKRRGRGPWALIGGVLVMIAIIIGIFFFLSQGQNHAGSTGGAADATTWSEVTAVSPSVIDSVGTGGQQKTLLAVKNGPPLTGPTGKPEVFYMGGEFCPYCAAERWAMVAALSRFGTLSKLNEITSSGSDVYPNTPTFTFYRSTYTSQYIDFVPVEAQGEVQGQPLQNPTSDQLKIINTYDAPPYFSNTGSFPFIDIANQQLLSGANYSPDTLTGLSWKTIAADLSNPASPVTKGIIGSANYLTAAICKATGQQPSSVCSDATIQQIEQSLGSTSLAPGGSAVAFADVPAKRRP